MTNNGRYIHLEQSRQAADSVRAEKRLEPMWPPMDKEKIGYAFDRVREKSGRAFGLIDNPGCGPFFQFSGNLNLDLENYDKVRARADKGEVELFHLTEVLDQHLANYLISRAADRKFLLNIDEPWAPFERPKPKVDSNAEMAKHLRRVARAAEEYATSLETGRQQAVARAALSIAVDDLNEVNRL